MNVPVGSQTRQAVICTDNYNGVYLQGLDRDGRPLNNPTLWYANYTQGRASLNCPTGMRSLSEKTIATITFRNGTQQQHTCTDYSYGYIYSSTSSYIQQPSAPANLSDYGLPVYGTFLDIVPAGTGFSGIGGAPIRPYISNYDGGSASFQKEALCYSPAP